MSISLKLHSCQTFTSLSNERNLGKEPKSLPDELLQRQCLRALGCLPGKLLAISGAACGEAALHTQNDQLNKLQLHASHTFAGTALPVKNLRQHP